MMLRATIEYVAHGYSIDTRFDFGTTACSCYHYFKN